MLKVHVPRQNKVIYCSVRLIRGLFGDYQKEGHILRIIRMRQGHYFIISMN